jgi:hypothetical protein
METQEHTTGGEIATTGEPSRAGRASTFEEIRGFFVSLLEMQCTLIGAAGGIVVLAPTKARAGGTVARHVRGDESDRDARLLHDPEMLGRLERVGVRAISSPTDNGTRGVWEAARLSDGAGLYETGASHLILAAPLVAEGQVEGACVLVAPVSARLDPDAALTQLALTTAKFEAFLWRQQCVGEAEQRAKMREALELLDTALQGADAEAMGALMCHELARRFGCTRVSIGLIRHDRIRLTALSGADAVDRKGAAIEAIESAMEECADQDTEIIYPAPEAQRNNPAERRVTRAHGQLSSRFGPSAMLSLPLRVEGGLVGVVLMEREASDPFPPGSAPLLRLVSEFIGPALYTRRMADRGVLAVVRDRLGDLARGLVGPRHTTRKLVALVFVLALVASMIPFPGRMGADAEVHAEVSRTIAPPFTGFLGKVNVRPGDEVQEGQLLASMDTSEMELNRAELVATKARLLIERDDARSKRDFPRADIATARIEESQAQIDKLDALLAKADVKAPITGQVSRGDLEPFVGARVDPTQPLFELVTREQVLVLDVDERDIARVRARSGDDAGTRGWFSPRATPGVRHEIEVVRINPVAEAVAGANVYKAEAVFTEGASGLAPGSTGRARLEDSMTTALISTFGPIVDQLRLRLWW